MSADAQILGIDPLLATYMPYLLRLHRDASGQQRADDLATYIQGLDDAKDAEIRRLQSWSNWAADFIHASHGGKSGEAATCEDGSCADFREFPAVTPTT